MLLADIFIYGQFYTELKAAFLPPLQGNNNGCKINTQTHTHKQILMANNKISHPYFCVFMMLSACISCLERLFRGCQNCLPPTFSSFTPGFLQKCGGGREIWEGESSQNLSLKTSSYTQHLTSRGSKNTADLSEKIENFYSHP